MFESVRLLHTRKKVTVIVLVLTSIALCLVLLHYIRVSSYRPLYTELSSRDASAVTSWLQDRNIDFTTENHGRDIHIEANRVHQVRLDLSRDPRFKPATALKVVPKSGIYSIIPPGVPADYAGLETELAHTITALHSIDSARIIIDPLRTSGTFPRSLPPRATVFVNPAPAGSISEADISTIISLVSRSVTGLEADSVDIYDFQGRTLSSGSSDSSDRYRVSDLFSHQEAIENRLEHRASEIVDALIGPGRSLVKVSVTLDISKSETTAERYNQDNAVVVKEHTEFASGSTYTVPENTDRIRYIPPVPTLSSTDYEVDRIINKTTTAPGSIKRLSVSVLVSGITNHPGDPSPVAHLPGEEEIQIIRKALSSLISIQPERGDTLTVIPVPARPAALEHTGIETSHRLPIDLIIPATKFAILIAGLIFVYMLIIRPLLRFLAADDRKISEIQSLEPDENEPVPDEAAGEDVTLVLKKEIVIDPSPTVHIIKNWLQET